MSSSFSAAASASGSSSILSLATEVCTAALASFFRFEDSFSFSQRSRNFTMIARWWQRQQRLIALQHLRTCFSLSARTERSSSSNSRTRRTSCASFRSRPGPGLRVVGSNGGGGTLILANVTRSRGATGANGVGADTGGRGGADGAVGGRNAIEDVIARCA